MAEPRAILSVSGPDLPTDQIQVGKGRFSVGRIAENNLPLNNQKVSRHHADFFWDGEHFQIEDLESSNGTFVNDARIDPRKPTTLAIKDVVRIGPFTLTVASLDAGLDAPPPKPVEVATPEPPAPVPPAPPPVGAPMGDAEAPAVVYRSEPPPSPNEAPTVEPQRTAPPTPEIKDVPVKPAPRRSKSDAALATPPTRMPNANGHSKPAPVPYRPVEGVPTDESRYMQFLPGVYHDSDFLKRYLLIMESLLAPIEWGVDSFEQFYDPRVTTPDWLQWIGSWFDIVIHPSVPIERQRAVVRELGALFRSRGTRRCLSRLMELYFGVQPEIIELEDPPSAFTVKMALPKKENTPLARALAEQLITAVKPAYTSFTLEISEA